MRGNQNRMPNYNFIVFFISNAGFAVMGYTVCHDFDSTIFVKIPGDIKMVLK